MPRKFTAYPSKFPTTPIKATTEKDKLANDVVALLSQSNRIVEDFLTDGEFDPYATLTDSEDMSQQLYRASVNFQQAIQDAVDTYREATTFDVSLQM